MLYVQKRHSLQALLFSQLTSYSYCFGPRLEDDLAPLLRHVSHPCTKPGATSPSERKQELQATSPTQHCNILIPQHTLKPGVGAPTAWQSNGPDRRGMPDHPSKP